MTLYFQSGNIGTICQQNSLQKKQPIVPEAGSIQKMDGRVIIMMQNLP